MEGQTRQLGVLHDGQRSSITLNEQVLFPLLLELKSRKPDGSRDFAEMLMPAPALLLLLGRNYFQQTLMAVINNGGTFFYEKESDLSGFEELDDGVFGFKMEVSVNPKFSMNFVHGPDLLSTLVGHLEVVLGDEKIAAITKSNFVDLCVYSPDVIVSCGRPVDPELFGDREPVAFVELLTTENRKIYVALLSSESLPSEVMNEPTVVSINLLNKKLIDYHSYEVVQSDGKISFNFVFDEACEVPFSRDMDYLNEEKGTAVSCFLDASLTLIAELFKNRRFSHFYTRLKVLYSANVSEIPDFEDLVKGGEFEVTFYPDEVAKSKKGFSLLKFDVCFKAASGKSFNASLVVALAQDRSMDDQLLKYLKGKIDKFYPDDV